MSIPSQTNIMLYKLYEECRILLNTTNVGEQGESMRRMAHMVRELEKKLMHQIPPELIEPMNGSFHKGYDSDYAPVYPEAKGGE